MVSRGLLSCHWLSPAVNAVNGLSSSASSQSDRSNSVQELYFVPWCSFTSLCKLKLEVVMYHETNTVDFPGFASRYSIYYGFSSYPIVHISYQELFDSQKRFKTSLNAYKCGCARTHFENEIFFFAALFEARRS